MSGTDDDTEKSHEPTQKKLDDARKKGEVPRSTDLTTAASYAGLVLTATAFGAASLSDMGQTLAHLVSQADVLALQTFSGDGTVLNRQIGAQIFNHLFPVLTIPGAFALLCIFGQQAFTVTGTKVQPKLSRISILSNAKNKFGRNGLFEFFKSFAKLLLYSTILNIFLWSQMPDILTSINYEARQVSAMMMRLVLVFAMLVLTVACALGAIDFLWQRAQHLRTNRMSFKDLSDESKESEGDPYMKSRRRQRAYDIATNQMLTDVPHADVIIVNPTHFSVALKWDRKKGCAPTCVAKGVDEIAARIREIAKENGIPIHSDPPTARLLHSVVNIGEEVRPDHYVAVAAAIRFAETMQKKARRS